MSATIIKFPRWARFRTKAQQAHPNKLFRRWRKDNPEWSDGKAFKFALMTVKLSEKLAARSEKLHRERTAAAAGEPAAARRTA